MTIHPSKDEQTGMAILAIILAVAGLWAIGCGSSGSSSTTPTTPTPTTATTTPSSATINIVNTNGGNRAFDPNLAQVASGGTIVWKNTTSDLHHLVMNDGSAVIGDIAPGASVTWQLKGSGGYHCTNHPTMVGSINGTSAPPDATPTPGGGYTY